VAISLRARFVYPVNRPPIEHGIVTIEEERIVAVGGHRAADGPADLGSVALVPGFVNAHTHLEFSELARPLGAPAIPLPEWIRLVIADRGRRGATARDAIAAGVAESLAHGVTAVGEIAATDPVAYTETNELCEIDTTLFVEVIGFSRARAASAFASVVARLDELHRVAPNCRMGLSPHAPYTVSPLLVQELIELARKRNLPVAMHLAESAEELEFLDTGTGPFQALLDVRSMWDPSAVPYGSRPFDYLCLLANAPRSLVIHGNYLDAAEREFLATHRDRLSLVYCPRTHEYFGHPTYSLAELLSTGVKVALGTDSRASNPDLSILAEMGQAARCYPGINPQEILRMGTLTGAEALGRGNDIGSITSGKLANLVAIPLPSDTKTSDDALASILANETAPSQVWLRGRDLRP
jgi:cytosine/adenosine deaminase-related metal-dependent hydrolase